MTLPSSTSDLMATFKLDAFSAHILNSLSKLVFDVDELTGLNLSTSANRLNDQNNKLFGKPLEMSAADQAVDHGAGCNCAHCVGSKALTLDKPTSNKPASNQQPVAFNTVSPTGESLPGEDPVNSSQLKWTRTTTSSGQKRTLVTYGFDPRLTLNGISNTRLKSLFASALQTWATYAPLEFREVEVKGKGKDVDILVQVDNIDGPSNMLAQAYFPIWGDIIFDGDEKWTEAVFLETALHELGHSLGLAHEDDVDAILNSKLASRFEKDLNPFLFPDDIAGIQRLYGSGSGSVTTLSDDVVEPPEADIVADVAEPVNLVVNGSFEDAPVEDNRYETYDSITGWQAIGDRVFQVDRRTEKLGRAADGTAWVELDARQGNASFGQNIDTVTGQAYVLSVDFTNGGRSPSTTNVEVFWEGRLIKTLTGGSKGQWQSFDLNVQGGDRNVSTLAFRAVGPADYTGGFIDNVQLFARPAFTQDSDYSLGASRQGTSRQTETANSELASTFDPTLVMSESWNVVASSGFV